MDGNKQAAAMVSETLPVPRGHALAASDAELVVAFLALAAGELSEDALAAWFRDRLVPA